MCWVCDGDKSQIAKSFWADKQTAHFQRQSSEGLASYTLSQDQSTITLAGKYYDAFAADGIGDLKPITLNAALLLTPDDVADDTSTTDSVTVDGGSVVST